MSCHRRKRTENARKQRLRRRHRLVTQNEKLRRKGKQVCTSCLKVRVVSEFRTSLPSRKGKLNKICDRCLAKAYETRSIPYNRLRTRAYAVNCVARSRLARERRVPISQVKLSDLDYICNPQDLAELIERQQGQCAYCHIDLGDAFSIDHCVPLCRDGAVALSNLAAACIDCNHLKHDKTVEEFLVFVAAYAARFVKATPLDLVTV